MTYQFKLLSYFFGFSFLLIFKILASNFEYSIVSRLGITMLGTFTHDETKLTSENNNSCENIILDNNDIILSIFRCSICIRHSLNTVSMVTEEHDGNPGNLPDSPLEILVTGGHDVRLVLGHTGNQAVVSVGPLILTTLLLK